MLRRLSNVGKTRWCCLKLLETLAFRFSLRQIWLHNTVVNVTAQTLDVVFENLAENAYAKKSDANDDTEAMKLNQSEASRPDDFRMKIYEEATTHLRKLMKNLKNAEAKSNLKKLNKQITKQNFKNRLSKKNLQNFIIEIFILIINFEMARPYLKALEKNPADEIARRKLININNVLRQLNERHEYSETWVITIEDSDSNEAESSKAAESFEAAASQNVNKARQTFIKDGVKIKVNVLILDESNGRTSLEKVKVIRKAGFGSRVIVKREMNMNSYFKIYSGAEFEKEVAKEWMKERMYEFEDLSRDTAAKNMRIYERVKVKKTNQRRVNKIARTQSEIQYYLIKMLKKQYVSIRSALSEMKELSSVKLKHINAQLNRQNEKLFAELDQCRANNVHSNIKEQLTSHDIEEMSWLSSNVIFWTKNKNDDVEKTRMMILRTWFLREATWSEIQSRRSLQARHLPLEISETS